MTRFLQFTLAAVTVATLACAAGSLRTPATAAPDDNTIAVRVRTALSNAPDVHPADVQVEVASGVVVLKGEVRGGEREITAAVQAARSVSGVRDVKSELKSKQ
jgi:osmotically-inducible protein OsmY